MADCLPATPGTPTGTPGNGKRKRRSWFEPGKSMTFDIAVEHQKPQLPVSPPVGDMETLELTHFTAPPRIDFGQLRVGKSKTRYLRVKNPEDFEQNVVVEKFPHKKGFSIDNEKFTVLPEDDIVITIFWTPDQACNSREMVLFRVDGVYRLQAYVFGKAEEPPKAKKLVRRGVAGRGKKPLGVLQPTHQVSALKAPPAKQKRTPSPITIEGTLTVTQQPKVAQKKQSKGRRSNAQVQCKENKENASMKGMDRDSLEDDSRIAMSVQHVLQPKTHHVDEDEPEIPSFPDHLKNETPVMPAAERISRYEKVHGKFQGSETMTLAVAGDPHHLDTPTRRGTYIKEEEAVPQDTETPSRRTTFRKDDPTLPITPLRRHTYMKDEPNLPNTPVIEMRSPVLMRSSAKRCQSASPVRRREPAMTPVRSADDSCLQQAASHLEVPASLPRSGTYTKLDGSPSPGPHRLHFTSTSPGIAEESFNETSPGSLHLEDLGRPSVSRLSLLQREDASLLRDVSHSPQVLEERLRKLADTPEALQRKPLLSRSPPAESKYCTAFTTPYRSPGEESGDDEVFEDSVMYLPGDGGHQLVVNVLSQDLAAMEEEVVVETKVVTTEMVEEVIETEMMVTTETVVTTEVMASENEAGFTSESVKSSETAVFGTVEESRKVIESKESRAECLSSVGQSEPVIRATKTVNREDIWSEQVLNAQTPNRKKTNALNNADELTPVTEVILKDKRTSVNQHRSAGVDMEIWATETEKILKFTPTKGGKATVTVTVTEAPDTDDAEQQDGIVPSNEEQAPSASGSLGVHRIPEPTLSPNTLLEESFSHQEVLDQLLLVKRGMHDRMSSTPVIQDAPKDLFTRSTKPKAPSPITVDQRTVSKSRPSLPLRQQLENCGDGPPERRQSRKELFTDIPGSPNHRRFSTLTVTKTKVEDLRKHQPGTTPKAKTELFADGPQDVDKEPKSPQDSENHFDDDSLENIVFPAPETKESFPIHTSKVTAKLCAAQAKATTKPPQASQRPVRQPLQRQAQAVRPEIAHKSLLSLKKRPLSADRANIKMSHPAGAPCTKKRKSVEGEKVKEVPVEEVEDDAVGRTGLKLTRTQQLRRAALVKAGKLPPEQNKDAKRRASSTGTGPGRKPSTGRSDKGPKEVKGLAKSRLLLVKHQQNTALPKHPLPYAAKNMYYDERWLEKQERGFVSWLNFVLTPPDEHVDACKPQKINIGSLFLETKSDVRLAPTKEQLSLRAYSTRRRLNNLRRAACMLFQSEECVRVTEKVEREVTCGRLAIRTDRKIHADLGIKQRILELLLSYNPLWLRMGLETIYGELIMLQSVNDIIGLSRFIVTRLLGNPEIAAEFAHPTVPHLYRDGYDQALAKFSLKKFLLLVHFLDRAKTARLIHHDPCLFCKDSDVKASRDLLLLFSRDYLSGEGDITRHLGYFGYHVTHQQTAMDEYNFAVTNLAVDLKDGVRLVRVLEMLTSSWTLHSSLRVPAISRLQKIHNVSVVLKALTDRGMVVTDNKGNKVDARDLVQGHREKTLSVLWCIIFNFQVELLLNEAQLKEEISFLHQNLHLRACEEALKCDDIDLDMLGLPRDRRESTEPGIYFKSSTLGLLLRWCAAVCAYYGLKVENFTVSFSDGRALCFLLHHYHPSLLPRELIHTSTSQTYQSEAPANKPGGSESDGDDSFIENWTQSLNMDAGKSTNFDQLLANEKKNFKLLSEKVSELGGVPFMVKSADMSNTIPDEKVVITFVSYLCARLLDLRQETRAARTIQVWWRARRLKTHIAEYQQRQQAAVVLQHAARAFLARCRAHRTLRAAVTIQRMWKGVVARRRVRTMRLEKEEELKAQAATTVQALWRGFQTRRHLVHRHLAATRLQAQWHCHRNRAQFCRIQKAVCTIQARFRAKQQGHEARRAFLEKKSAVLKLQAVIRGFLARKLVAKIRAATLIQAAVRGYQQRRELRKQHSAAVRIQAWYRMVNARRELLKLREATVHIQQWYKAQKQGQKQRRAFLKLKGTVILAQCLYRQRLARKTVKRHRAAIKIQAMYRMHRRQVEFRQKRRAAMVIQTIYRRYAVRKVYCEQRQAVVTLQTWCRMLKQKRSFEAQRKATIVLQKHLRSRLLTKKDRTAFLQKKDAAILVQKLFRAKLARETAKKMRAARSIQAAFRGYSAKKKFRRVCSAVRTIQAAYRAHVFRKKNLAAKTIQAAYRGYLVRRCIRRQHEAALKLQAAFRGYLARQQCRREQCSAAKIQAAFRGFLARKRMQKECCAACKIQASVRGFLARRSYLKKQTTACKVQATVRCFLARKKYLRMQQASVRIQSVFRGYVARKEYTRKRDAALKLQALFRGFIARRKYLRVRKATCKIQAVFRGFVIRRHFSCMKVAAKTIQAVYKGYRERRKYLRCKNAAVVIQTAYRGYAARKHCQVMQKAAQKIQAVYRGFSARKRFSRQKNAAVLIQAACKGFLARRKYHKQVKSIVKIQTAYRGFIIRKRLQIQQHNAIKIQAAFRAYVVKKSYQKKLCAVKTIQAAFRGYVARQALRRQQQAAIKIQAVYKAFKARKQYQALRNAACTIQAAIRGYLVRKTYMRQQIAALKIQSLYRLFSARKAYLTQRSAVLKIQTFYRGFAARKQYVLQQKAALKIQTAYRCFSARKAYQLQKAAACTIQTIYRGYVIRKSYMKMRNAALLIQTNFRGFIVRRDMKTKVTAAIRIQNAYRAYLCRKQYHANQDAALRIQTAFRGWKLRRDFLQQRNAAQRIQAVVRGYLVRKSFEMKRKAAVRIQAVYRSFAARKQYKQQQKAAIKIQTAYRCFAVRKAYQMQKVAALKIQTIYRGYIIRKSYKKMRNAALLIQTNYRGFIVRRDMKTKVTAAIRIQNAYRGYLCRKQYQANQDAALRIQTAFRGWKLRREFLQQRNAAQRIQAVVRGYLVRRSFKVKMKAAVSIQAVYRGFVTRRIYQRLKSTVVRIQAIYRGFVARREYQRLLHATVTIQAAYRGHKARCEYLSQQRAARMIQAAYRCYTVKKNYQNTLRAICKIQACFRSYAVRRDLQNQNLAALKIQAAYRGHVARQWYQRQVNSIIKIQAWTRMLLVRAHIQEQREAVSILERYWRATLDGCKQRRAYLRLKGTTILAQCLYRRRLAVRRATQERAARTIQACYRMYRARSEYLLCRCAAVTIQAWWRGVKQQHQYWQVQEAVLTVQRQYRAVLVGRSTRQEFVRLRGAVVLGQRLYRQKIAQRHIARVRAAVTIQAWYRGLQVRQRYQRLRVAAVTLQQRFRATQVAMATQRDYLALRTSVVSVQRRFRQRLALKRVARSAAATKIQSTYRMYKERSKFIRQRAAAIQIQAWIRSKQGRKDFLALRETATTLQQHIRAYLAGKAQRTAYLSQRAASVIIQRVYRCYEVRKLVKHIRAARTIQAVYRGYKARTQYKSMKEAAVTIQRAYRSSRLVKYHKIYFHMMRGATIVLQSFVRGALVRRRLCKQKAASCIQRIYRGYAARQAYHNTRSKVITAQAVVRGHLQLRRYQQLKAAAVMIQGRWRAALAVRQQRQQFLAQRSAALTIQAWYKAVCERRRYQDMRVCVIRLQAAYRGCAVRRHLQQQHAAATKIQATVKGELARKQYKALRKATVSIQMRWRALIHGRRVRRDLLVRHAAALVIQTVWRQTVSRRCYTQLKHAAIKIQAAVRRHQQMQQYNKLKIAAVTLQKHYRGWQARQQVKRHQAATKIQAYYCGYKARQWYKRQRECVTRLQSYVRLWQVRKRLAEMRKKWSAAVCIQKCYRKYRTQRLIKEQRERRVVYLRQFSVAVHHHLAAVVLQRAWRRQRVLRLAQRQLPHVLTLQHWVRGRLVRLRYLKLVSTIRAVQAASKSYLQKRQQAAVVVQRTVRTWLAKRRVIRRHKSALLIQTVWRGHRVRRTSRSKALVLARRRLHEAHSRATEDQRLGNKTSSALESIFKCKQVAYVLEAVKNLDLATQLSPVCREKLVEQGACAVLWRLIRCCNRSVPHMEIIKYALHTLLNLAKYEKTGDFVYEAEGSVDTMLDLMIIYREKGPIFMLTCTLLGILCFNPQNQMEVSSSTKVQEKLRSVHALTLRKHQMDLKHKVAKMKMAAARGTGPLPPVIIPTKRSRHSSKNTTKMQIEDPLSAIEFVMRILHISPK